MVVVEYDTLKWTVEEFVEGVLPGVGIWDGHVVTKPDRWVSSRYSGFIPREDHSNANIGANEHDLYNVYYLFRNRCKIYKVYYLFVNMV